MFLEELTRFLPDHWSPMNLRQKWEMIEVPSYTSEYTYIKSQFQGIGSMGPIYRIQNPVLFTKFYMKTIDYEMRGDTKILTLYHDTVQSNVESIAAFNIDWRYGERFKYGPGVYFSTSSFTAQRRANRELGQHRAMFLVNVLVGRTQVGRSEEFLPDIFNDTVVSPDGETYVKYFDSEYYPTYVQFYTASS
ncbi:hypothetical protein HHI36_011749 [Cryptolaemus montrouzieri]|uniref:Poly [ADP-ribose] polymerase n=1 Tax=Cryptolaemus montrouzieri TaxID=559131 RepID=A0ABD2ND59_9CUCU